MLVLHAVRYDQASAPASTLLLFSCQPPSSLRGLLALAATDGQPSSAAVLAPAGLLILASR